MPPLACAIITFKKFSFSSQLLRFPSTHVLSTQTEVWRASIHSGRPTVFSGGPDWFGYGVSILILAGAPVNILLCPLHIPSPSASVACGYLNCGQQHPCIGGVLLAVPIVNSKVVDNSVALQAVCCWPSRM